MMKEPQLLVNAMITPDGTFLESVHRHDYKSHLDSVTGFTYMVDGGLDYIRHSKHPPEFAPEYVVLYSDSNHKDLREYFRWGTYGPNGDQPKKLVQLRDLEEDHIKAIINTQKHLDPDFRRVFFNELLWRGSEE